LPNEDEENQQRLRGVGIHNDRVAASRLNFATFHCPDGVRTNYGQWRSLENFEELRKDPKYAPLNEYWQVWLKTSFIFTKLSSQNLLIKSSSFSE